MKDQINVNPLPNFIEFVLRTKYLISSQTDTEIMVPDTNMNTPEIKMNILNNKKYIELLINQSIPGNIYLTFKKKKYKSIG